MLPFGHTPSQKNDVKIPKKNAVKFGAIKRFFHTQKIDMTKMNMKLLGDGRGPGFVVIKDDTFKILSPFALLNRRRWKTRQPL